MPITQKQQHKFIDVLDDDETLYWVSSTSFYTFMLRPIVKLMLGLFWGLWVGLIIFLFFRTLFNDKNIFWLMLAFTLVILLPTFLVILNVIIKFFAYFNTYYAFSNKRLLKRSGIFGNDYEALDFDQIDNIAVREGMVEQNFGVGSIIVSMPEYNRVTEFLGVQLRNVSDDNDRYFIISGIKNPHQVYKQLRTLALDTRTDWQYPNALRPDNNPGLPTTTTHPEPYNTNPDWQRVNTILNEQTPSTTDGNIPLVTNKADITSASYPLEINAAAIHNVAKPAPTQKKLPSQPSMQQSTQMAHDKCAATKQITDTDLKHMVAFDTRLSHQFTDLLDDDETLYWVGKPRSTVFNLLAIIAFGILVFFNILLAIGIAGWIAYAQNQTFYAISNKRFLRKTWLLGGDNKTLDYDKVTTIDTFVDPISKYFNTGTLTIQSNSGVAFSFFAINEPYEVERLAKIVTLDIKTDVQFPNAHKQ